MSSLKQSYAELIKTSIHSLRVYQNIYDPLVPLHFWSRQKIRKIYNDDYSSETLDYKVLKPASTPYLSSTGSKPQLHVMYYIMYTYCLYIPNLR